MAGLMETSVATVIEHGMARLNCAWLDNPIMWDTIALYDGKNRIVAAWQTDGTRAGCGHWVSPRKPRSCVTVAWRLRRDRIVAVTQVYWATAAGLLQRARSVTFVQEDGVWTLDGDQPRFFDTSKAIDPMRAEIEEMLTL